MKANTQENTEQSTPQGRPSLGTWNYLNGDQALGDRATEDPKVRQREMTFKWGGRHPVEFPFRCHLLPAALPHSRSPRATSFPASRENEGSRGGRRKRVKPEEGPRASVSRFAQAPSPLCLCPGQTHSLFLPSTDGKDHSTLPAHLSPSVLVGCHQGALTRQGPLKGLL